MQHPRMMTRTHDHRAAPIGRKSPRKHPVLHYLDEAWASPLGGAALVIMIVAVSVELASFLMQVAY